MDKLSVTLLIPCYNEADNIDIFFQECRPFVKSLDIKLRFLFVDDGSRDQTCSIIQNYIESDVDVSLIKLTRNFGKEAAMMAGLRFDYEYLKSDAIIPIDCDLQDPVALIETFIFHWQQGHEMVVGQRLKRVFDSPIQRILAKLFYRIHRLISRISIPENVGDVRLISRKVVAELVKLNENQLFMKGLFAWTGYPYHTVTYTRPKRKAGYSKFNIWKLWNFALDGICSFSSLPLRFWLYIGSFISFFSFLYGSFIIIKTVILGIDVPGYASLFSALCFFGGLQLLSIGILGEYVGRIYLESKRRPAYVIESIIQTKVKPKIKL